MNNENVHVICAYYIKVMLGDLCAEGLLEDIFKWIWWKNKSLHVFANVNGMRLVQFATSKSLIAKSTSFHFTHSGLHVLCFLNSHQLFLDSTTF